MPHLILAVAYILCIFLHFGTSYEIGGFHPRVREGEEAEIVDGCAM